MLARQMSTVMISPPLRQDAIKSFVFFAVSPSKNFGLFLTPKIIFFFSGAAGNVIANIRSTVGTMQMNNSQDSRNYDPLTDMPVVAAVRVEAPQNPVSSTAIEVDGLWYQPIGVMPSSKSKSIQGSAMTEEIRKVASKEQGRHLVTANGLPNGQPLITHVYGVFLTVLSMKVPVKNLLFILLRPTLLKTRTI